MPNEGRVGGEVSADDAPKRSRKERRAEKRRVHEAQTKAKVVDKANDKQAKGRNKMDKTEKKRKEGQGEAEVGGRELRRLRTALA